MSSRRNYSYYPPYESVAVKKKRNEAMLAKLKARDSNLCPVTISGRSIAKTFWGKAWCDHVESFHDYENRLPRGRSYVRSGAVIDVQIATGVVTAQVVGSASKPYQIEIEIKPLARTRWEALKAKCVGKISSLLSLVQGRLPAEILSEFCHRQEGLFPSLKEITMHCSCPDYAGLCKHLAAVLYGIGARLDEDPKLFFTLRGLNENELIGAELVDSLTAGAAPEIATADLGSMFGVEFDSMESTETAGSVMAAPAVAVPAPTRAPEWSAATVRDLRQRMDRNQAEFGKLLDVTGAMISAIERGRVNISVAQRQRLQNIVDEFNAAAEAAKVAKSEPIKTEPAARSSVPVTSWSAAAVRELRQRMDRTQAEFGILLGMSGAMVSFLERGRTKINPAMRKRLQKIQENFVATVKPATQVESEPKKEEPAVRPSAPVMSWSAATVRELRQRRGWNQAEFGKLLGVTGAMISLIERGRANISVAQRQRLQELQENSVAAVRPATQVESKPKKEEPAAVRPSAAPVMSWSAATVRELRQRRGWNQAELGKLLGVTGAMVSMIERGRANISAVQQQRLQELVEEFQADTNGSKPKKGETTALPSVPVMSWSAATVRELRQRRGWSQAELGKLLGVTRAMISLIEKGHANITVRQQHCLQEIAAAEVLTVLAQSELPPVSASAPRGSTVKAGGVNVKSWSAAEIVVLRQRLKLSQSAFAQRVGVSAMTVSNWERGKATPTSALNAKISALRS